MGDCFSSLTQTTLAHHSKGFPRSGSLLPRSQPKQAILLPSLMVGEVLGDPRLTLPCPHLAGT